MPVAALSHILGKEYQPFTEIPSQHKFGSRRVPKTSKRRLISSEEKHVQVELE
jgi:hypothetical protein